MDLQKSHTLYIFATVACFFLAFIFVFSRLWLALIFAGVGCFALKAASDINKEIEAEIEYERDAQKNPTNAHYVNARPTVRITHNRNDASLFAIHSHISNTIVGELQASFIVVDVETTGLHTDNDRIIQISAVHFKNGHESSHFSEYIRPSVAISKEASRVSGITMDMLWDAQSESSVMREFSNYLDKIPNSARILVAHNARFDAGFISNAFSRCGINSDVNLIFYDTLYLARRCVPQLASHKLSDVCRFYDIDTGRQHDAYDDAVACGKVFTQLLEYTRQNPDPYFDTWNVAEYPEALRPYFSLLNSIELQFSTIKANKQFESEACAKLIENCQAAIELFNQNKTAMNLKMCGAYKRLVMTYAERNDYTNAISVCEQAIANGASDDGTKGGMEGRMLVLKKKAAKYSSAT